MAAARDTVDDILRVLDVARVDGEVIRRALRLGWPDFEDAVTAAAAEAARCEAIVTRDPKGFPRSPVRVITPEAAAPLLL
jgi:predicted nucleic acid-binding protein